MIYYLKQCDKVIVTDTRYNPKLPSGMPLIVQLYRVFNLKIINSMANNKSNTAIHLQNPANCLIKMTQQNLCCVIND